MSRILTWNVRHGGSNKPAIADAIADMRPDVAIITEFREVSGGCDLAVELRARGLEHTHHSSPGKDNGVLLASRHPLIPVSTCNLVDAGRRWAHARVPELACDIAGAYIPVWARRDSRKQEFWNWMLEAVATLSDRSAVIGGDWNTGSNFRDEEGRTLRCADSFEALEKSGWRDCYRVLHPDGKERSWWSNKGNGFRLDHVFFSPAGPSAPTRAEYVEEMGRHRLVRRGGMPGLSDHAALIVDF